MLPMSVHKEVTGVVGIRRLFLAKEWRRVPLVSKVFLSFVFVQTVAYIVIRALKFKQFSVCRNLTLRDQIWILSIAVALNVSVIYFAINAVIRQKITELYSFMLASLLQVLRGFFDYLNEGAYPLMIADIALCSTAFLVYMPLCYLVSRAFGWTTFALAGGDDIKQRVLYWFFAFVTVLKFRFLITLLILFTFSMFLFSAWWQMLILILIIPAIMLYVSITLISKSKRENTRIVAMAYVVQVLIFFSVIGMFSFAISLPTVQKFEGLGLVSGLDFSGVNIEQNPCRPNTLWDGQNDIGSCPSGSSTPTFFGCSDSGNMFSDFDDLVNSVNLASVIREDSIYRCLELEDLIKNGSSFSQNICGSNVNRLRSSFTSAKTFMVRLFRGCASNSNPYAGCFPVKRSVGLTFISVMMAVFVLIHFLEIFSLMKLASLKGLGLEGMLRQRAMNSLNDHPSFEEPQTYYVDFAPQKRNDQSPK